MNNQSLILQKKTPAQLSKLWRINNRKRYNNYQRIYNNKQKLKVLRHYGGSIPRCKKCGICDIRFLVLDHINGGGKEDRKLHGRGSTFYAWIVKVNFPIGFQILCSYCNLQKNRRTNYE